MTPLERAVTVAHLATLNKYLTALDGLIEAGLQQQPDATKRCQKLIEAGEQLQTTVTALALAGR